MFGPVDKRVDRSTEDLSHGAQYVPEKVLRARQAGKEVVFVMRCGPCCWYWKLPGFWKFPGLRIFHCEQWVRDNIAHWNGKNWDGKILGKAGPCPSCGNTHTNGETVRLEIRLVILRIFNSLIRRL